MSNNESMKYYAVGIVIFMGTLHINEVRFHWLYWKQSSEVNSKTSVDFDGSRTDPMLSDLHQKLIKIVPQHCYLVA